MRLVIVQGTKALIDGAHPLEFLASMLHDEELYSLRTVIVAAQQAFAKISPVSYWTGSQWLPQCSESEHERLRKQKET